MGQNCSVSFLKFSQKLIILHDLYDFSERGCSSPDGKECEDFLTNLWIFVFVRHVFAPFALRKRAHHVPSFYSGLASPLHCEMPGVVLNTVWSAYFLFSSFQ